MHPSPTCLDHGKQLEELRTLTEAVHHLRSPGWKPQLASRLAEVITKLESFDAEPSCCPGVDRLSLVVRDLLVNLYREHLGNVDEAKYRRNLGRKAYDLTRLLPSLHGDHHTLIHYPPRAYDLYLEPGSHLEQHLKASGESFELVAGSIGLGAMVAARRGLDRVIWFSYVVTPMDRKVLAELGSDRRHSDIGRRPVGWLGTRGGDTVAVLEALGRLGGADRAVRETIAVLCDEWEGSVDDLVAAARTLC